MLPADISLGKPLGAGPRWRLPQRTKQYICIGRAVEKSIKREPVAYIGTLFIADLAPSFRSVQVAGASDAGIQQARIKCLLWCRAELEMERMVQCNVTNAASVILER